MNTFTYERMKLINLLFDKLAYTSSRNEKLWLVDQFKKEHSELSQDLDYCLEVLAGRHKINFTLAISDKCPGCHKTLELDGFCYDPECKCYDPVGHEYAPMLSIEQFCQPLFQLKDLSEASIYEVQKLFRGYGWFLNPLFNRTLRLGIGQSLLEKSDISPMLAKKYDPDKVPLDKKYFLTEKLDGNRCIAKFNFETEKWEFYSRSGKTLKVDFDMGALPVTYVFDGEILSKDQLTNPSQENFNKLSGLVNSLELNKTQLIYMIFDLMIELPYLERSSILRGFCAEKLQNSQTTNVKILPILDSCVPEELNDHVDYYLDLITSRGGEGVMINLGSAMYQHKRTNVLLKVKNVYTMDMVVKDVIPGTGKNEGLVGSLECMCGSPYGDEEYYCKVGSGLNDQQRMEWAIHPEKIIGKIVEVAYFSLSQDKVSRGTTLYSLRFPRLKRVREDKNETSID